MSCGRSNPIHAGPGSTIEQTVVADACPHLGAVPPAEPNGRAWREPRSEIWGLDAIFSGGHWVDRRFSRRHPRPNPGDVRSVPVARWPRRRDGGA